MEDAYPIFDFLPISYRSEEEAEYIQFLWETFVKNYESEKYQFAFLSYHMLFMSFVYFNIWQIRKMEEDDYNKVTLGFNECFEIPSSPFSFSQEQERKIFEIFKYWGLPKDYIGKYKKLVNDRNDVAHSNGNIIIRTEPSLSDKIRQILRYAEEIQNASKATLQRFFTRFLIENQYPETRQYLNTQDQVKEAFIHESYLSKKDLGICLNMDFNRFKSESNYAEIDAMILELMKIYFQDD